jgi:hypothetical protein
MTITARHALVSSHFCNLVAVLTAALLVGTLHAAGFVTAQQAGDTITFALPAGTEVTPGAEGDKVIYAGRPLGLVGAEDCASDGELRPMQPVMLVDAGSGTRATRSQGLVTLYVNGIWTTELVTGIKNGTRIGNLSGPEDCFVNGAPYYRYTGIIE